MIQNEVEEFVNLIQAKRKAFDIYKGNIFAKDNTILIIKISRTEKVFYGVCSNILDLLIFGEKNKKIQFGIVLLKNNHEGWFYPENIVIDNIEKNIWKKATDQQYKINNPLDTTLYFNNCIEFKRIFSMYY